MGSWSEGKEARTVARAARSPVARPREMLYGVERGPLDTVHAPVSRDLTIKEKT
jgi:hypothetical protein